jgi:predicted DNA-binding ribbon-helix-helix protein
MDRESTSARKRGIAFGRPLVDPFVDTFNMTLAQPQSKSVRLNGFATCLRLESVYWNVLATIARANACSINALLSYIDREVHLRYGGVKNFSGLVRVVCVVHLQNGFQEGSLEAAIAQA